MTVPDFKFETPYSGGITVYSMGDTVHIEVESGIQDNGTVQTIDLFMPLEQVRMLAKFLTAAGASMREANAALATMSKKEIVATLLASNSTFSEAKLARKNRDDLVDFYGAELRRLLANKETAE